MALEHPDVPQGSVLVQQLAPFITGKTILTTGVSPGGLGASFVEAIAVAQPKLLILAGRSAPKAQQTAADLQARFPGLATRTLALDLASQAAVRQAAAEVLAWADVPAIDVLVLNAGIMGVPYGTTADGLELQFGSNYLGHWLFGNLVMGKVLAGGGAGPGGSPAPGGRVVSVASDGYRLDAVRFDDLDFSAGETYDPWRAYGQSKTGNMLYAVSLAEKLGPRGLLALSVHPGVISTNLSSHLGGQFDGLVRLDKEQGAPQARTGFKRITADQGVATHIFAAFSPDAAKHNGAYCHEAAAMPPEKVRAWGRDKVEAERLWQLSEQLVGQKFEW